MPGLLVSAVAPLISTVPLEVLLALASVFPSLVSPKVVGTVHKPEGNLGLHPPEPAAVCLKRFHTYLDWRNSFSTGGGNIAVP